MRGSVDHHVVIGMLPESRRHLANHQRAHLNPWRSMSGRKSISDVFERAKPKRYQV